MARIFDRRPFKGETQPDKAAGAVKHPHGVPEPIPHAPLVPEPLEGEEVGVAGGPCENLVSEFSWADADRRENNRNVPGQASSPTGGPSSNPAPAARRPAVPTPDLRDDEERFHHIARDIPNHADERRPNPLRGNSWILDND